MAKFNLDELLNAELVVKKFTHGEGIYKTTFNRIEQDAEDVTGSVCYVYFNIGGTEDTGRIRTTLAPVQKKDTKEFVTMKVEKEDGETVEIKLNGLQLTCLNLASRMGISGCLNPRTVLNRWADVEIEALCTEGTTKTGNTCDTWSFDLKEINRYKAVKESDNQ